MTRLDRIASLLLFALAGCTPSPSPGGATCEAACANLAARGCSAGAADAGCVAVCKHAPTDLNLACLSEAGDVPAIEACGTVRCR